MLTDAQIRGTLRDLAGQRVRQVWVHPRPGLMTPYLSDEWFRLWKVALDEARRLDMNVWIYDENSYPSGFAGGWVPELMPESRGRSLALEEKKSPPPWSDELLAVFRIDADTSENVTGKIRSGEALPEAKYLCAAIKRAGNSPWHGNRSYVDLIYPGVTEKFLEVTMEPYRRELGKHFGKRIPGVFTDEPEILPAGGLPWTEDLPEQFQKRRGYSLLENLPALKLPIGDWRKVRHNYYLTLLELFIERWAKPYYDYCAEQNLEFTGHYWEHEWPRCTRVPDNMAMAAWQQRPGIDTLMNRYQEHANAQFGNVRACREISSIANQLGRARTLCEVYGAGGWDLRFEDMKRIGDWLQVLGVNTLNEHLSYVTIRGARKRDHPQSFSYHEPWWEAYHEMANYFTRLSAALTQGEQINRALILEPTTTAWMYQGDGAKLNEIGDRFTGLIMALEAAQVEYDLGSEDVLARHGSAGKLGLRVGQRFYSTVVLPPMTENLNAPTVRQLAAFLEAGATVLSCGDAPSRMDGQLSEAAGALAKHRGWKRVGQDALHTLLATPDFTIRRTEADKGILFHHRRVLADGEILFLVNTSIEHPSSGAIRSALNGVEQWNLHNGGIGAYPFEKAAGGITAQFQLPPSGSLLLFLSKKAAKPFAPAREIELALQPANAFEIRRVDPNVLTLDHVDVSAGGETRTNIYFYDANHFAWQKNGMDRNPWDSAVQFKDELITKTFPASSGFEASYKFTIEGAVPANLAIVIERPDLYTITCNGQPISAAVKSSKTRAPSRYAGVQIDEFADWWLDRAFGRLELASVARTGENVVTIKAAPFTMFHELEPAYVLGNFTLKAAAAGFVIAPEEPLKLGWQSNPDTHGNNPDGTMWLSGGIGFEQNQRADGGDRAPFVIFDLRQPMELSAVKVWNYNESHVRDLTTRGASKVRISGAVKDSPDAFNIDLGTFALTRANGADLAPQVLPVRGRARYVRFDILANHNGITYPARGTPADNGFVGLAEVQFVDAADARVGNVSVLRFSGELPSHNRRARFLADGSGMGASRVGWNRQGHPFYGAGVAYRQDFLISTLQGRYAVSLPNWHGSVAKVTVNGKAAGWISAPPWECDVTRQLRRGSNTIEVTVIGTLKNTLGPHHGSPQLGAAWPAQFRKAPEGGLPSGDRYDTVAYGLFDPFVLKQITVQPAQISRIR